MIETGQDFTFRAKAAKHFIGVRAAGQEFDSYLFFKVSIRARRQIDRSHSTLTYLTNDNVGPDPFADFRDILPGKPGGGVICALFQAVIRIAEQRFRFG
jgi:hypothetical protein